MGRSVRLRVVEAQSRDPGKKVARIDARVMRELGVDAGDVVELVGAGGFVTTLVWPLEPGEEDSGIVRIDRFLREALGVRVGNEVEVRRVEAERATRVVLAPVGRRVSRGFIERVRRFLVGKPVARGETVVVTGFVPPLRLYVMEAEPGRVVLVGEDTSVELLEEPIVERLVAVSLGVGVPPGLGDELKRVLKGGRVALGDVVRLERGEAEVSLVVARLEPRDSAYVVEKTRVDILAPEGLVSLLARSGMLAAALERLEGGEKLTPEDLDVLNLYISAGLAKLLERLVRSTR
ncbi:AAA ATPase VAT domain protein [Pyrolobus fumarii 1A]|uniref:AAA ATPase VAT domain protein n=1 Tax=Pyrolobus fumarii (strain DSM 11204 / 1A) TaxID=694429 RepID=G0EE50_PYRF1|nr:ATPase AAA [Pyrolobus fumarii]AEM37966.1 AAA ATPase VAT domain protein [Pyrolobus fumarii 1A]